MENQQLLTYEGVLITLFVLIIFVISYNVWAWLAWQKRQKKLVTKKTGKFPIYTPGEIKSKVSR